MEQQTTFQTLRVPTTFWNDHEERILIEFSGEESDYIIKRGQKVTIVRLHPEDVVELMSDAEYYDDMREEGGYEWLCEAARRMVVSLKRQGVEQQHNWRVR